LVVSAKVSAQLDILEAVNAGCESSSNADSAGDNAERLGHFWGVMEMVVWIEKI
jgi:hypothetical protein